MKTPIGMTEQEVLDILNKVAGSLAYKFKFGSNTIEDMKQYGIMKGIEGLNDYDSTKGSLETFMWTHIRNRLYNLKRDNSERPDKPCLSCPLAAYDPSCLKSANQCTAYSDKMECSDYKKWYNRNAKKRNILHPIELGHVNDENENSMKISRDVDTDSHNAHIISIIDKHIPTSLRTLWVKLQNEISLNKSDKHKLLMTIKEILQEHNLDES